MDTVTLKRGKGKIKLSKNKSLIALKSRNETDIKEAISLANPNISSSALTTNMEGFQIVKLQGNEKQMEDTLNKLRTLASIDIGTHVFNTPDCDIPYIPTGEITLRFKSTVSQSEQQKLIDKYQLEIIDSYKRTKPDGSVLDTYTVKVTDDSPNPIKVGAELQKNELVLIAEPDLLTLGVLYNFEIPTDHFLSKQWHLKNQGNQLGLKVGADARVVEAWEKAQCLGVPSCTIAIIDDGFDLSHPDIAGEWKIKAPYDFGSNSTDPSPKRIQPDPRHSDWHGTAVAGVAVGNANGQGILGVAPNCSLMPIRWSMTLSEGHVEKWFKHAMNMGADIINCSWGAASPHYVLSTRQYEVIEDCVRYGRNGLGCVVVFAAGNDNRNISDLNTGSSRSFAEHPDVISVAACNSLDRKSHYSNYGKEISVCAPSNGQGGRGIFTSDVRGQASLNNSGISFPKGYEAGDYTRKFGGTSSSAPLVSGICGLLLSIKPGMKATEVKNLLERTARKIGNKASYNNGHSIYFGYGCVNASAAVQELLI